MDDVVMTGNQFLKAFYGFSIQAFPKPFLMCGKGVHRDRKLGVTAETTIARVEIALIQWVRLQ